MLKSKKTKTNSIISSSLVILSRKYELYEKRLEEKIGTSSINRDMSALRELIDARDMMEKSIMEIEQNLKKFQAYQSIADKFI